MKISSSKADAFVYDLTFNAVFRAMKTADKLIFLDKPFTKEPITWDIRKTNPEFMKFSNDFLARVKADGRFDKMYRK